MTPTIQTNESRPDAPERHITIAFDGACLGNPGPGGYGAVLVNDRSGRDKTVSGGESDTTNNRMELRAAIEALNALRPGAVVTMIGDSRYVLDGMTKWVRGWKAKGWRKADGKPVLNRELWEALEAAAANHAVTWTWTRGHAGHPLNERADRIAGEEAAKAAPEGR